ncbi:MAG: SURF1 family protein [Gammaproteobacteria bacterium]|nr:SURF1 family protein [Gammaproteobacteria bacterium]
MVVKIPVQQRKLFIAMSIFTVVLLPVLVSLGFWQLDRAKWREGQWSAFEAAQIQPPLTWTPFDEFPSHQRVTAEGQFLSEQQYFLQNRTYGGVPGVEVIELFETNHAVLAVNRGFVEWRLADELPAVRPATSHTIVGSIAPPDTNPVLSEINQLPRIQTRHFEQIEQRIGRPIVAEIRLAPEHSDALMASWMINAMTPEKHLGYATQWFAMAFALLILYGILILKITTKKGEVHAHSC